MCISSAQFVLVSSVCHGRRNICQIQRAVLHSWVWKRGFEPEAVDLIRVDPLCCDRVRLLWLRPDSQGLGCCPLCPAYLCLISCFPLFFLFYLHSWYHRKISKQEAYNLLMTGTWAWHQMLAIACLCNEHVIKKKKKHLTGDFKWCAQCISLAYA